MIALLLLIYRTYFYKRPGTIICGSYHQLDGTRNISEHISKDQKWKRYEDALGLTNTVYSFLNKRTIEPTFNFYKLYLLISSNIIEIYHK